MKKIVLILIGIVLFSNVYSQIPIPKPNTYINDYVGVLNESEVSSLNERILALEKKTSIQIAVILINELPENTAIEDYTREIGRKWGVGLKDNGIVYVAVMKTHAQRLEVAKRLEGSIPDITALKLLQVTKPFYRNRDFKGGINALVHAIDKILSPEDVAEQKAIGEKKESNSYIYLIAFLLLFVFAGFAYYIFVYLPNEKEKKQEEEENRKKVSEAIQSFKQDLKPTRNNIPFPPRSIYNSPTERKKEVKKPTESSYIAPIVSSNDNSSYSNYSSSSSSSNDNSSSYGNWGSSSDSSSGFDGGGSSDSGSSGGSDW